MTGIYRLNGTVKHYDWGGFFFLPTLLQMDNAEKRPFAEYWMGIHGLGNSTIELPGNNSVLLSDYLKDDPLPYLLKILDVRKMLSIQVHPSKTVAEKGFAAENAAGIPTDSPTRNYRDDNHKPELLVAVGDFWLVHGFKQPGALRDTLKTVPEFAVLLSLFEKEGYEGLYRKAMTMPQQEVNALLQPLLDRIIPLYKEDKLNRSQEHFWAARAALSFGDPQKIDRGIFSIYFFNIVHLNSGEAIFQDAGVPHAYLEGVNVEIMANSDNVLRGGLTSKHVDIPEVLKNVKCAATEIRILKGEVKGQEKKYVTTAPDFELSVFELKAGDKTSFLPVTAEIIILTEGNAELSSGSTKVNLAPGKPSAIAFPGQPVTLNSNTGAMVFRASVPVHRGDSSGSV